jgi:hypothetical protein
MSRADYVSEFSLIIPGGIPQLTREYGKFKEHINKGIQNQLRFKVFTAVTMKNAVFWDMVSCRSCVDRRFGGAYHLTIKVEQSASKEPAWAVLLQIAATEGGVDTFLRNVGSYKIYMVPHPTTRHLQFKVRSLLFNLWTSTVQLILLTGLLSPWHGASSGCGWRRRP